MPADKVELPCGKHGSHPPWKMRKKWVEKAEHPSLPTGRVREAFCPEDVRYGEPLGFWTGAGWAPIPGKFKTTAWCPWDQQPVTTGSLEVREESTPKGQAYRALCPRCGHPIAKVNRWGFQEALFRDGQKAPAPSP